MRTQARAAMVSMPNFKKQARARPVSSTSRDSSTPSPSRPEERVHWAAGWSRGAGQISPAAGARVWTRARTASRKMSSTRVRIHFRPLPYRLASS